jgi:hypothetical protein
MGLRDVARWEIAGVSSGVALIFLNPFAYRIGNLFFGMFGNAEWYASKNNIATPAGTVMHIAVFFFVLYLFLRIDWECTTI